ncbi:MAG: glucose-1-phosphate adenylyltransferase [Candidatus Binatia bacterium]|nr:MAG: glucose-1-phosphate adenylyltransferase [Candidatus Binatia bacterium]
MKEVVAVVLGGGRGTRLYPLTQWRSKPAVPLAGKYRLVDVPISNCINSGLRQIFVLSQFQSASLNRHISRTYRFDPFTPGFVEILAAEQTEASMDWYQGTADAVRKQLHRFLRHGVEHILILSGDQLYVMDFRSVLEQHTRTGADITIAVTPVTERDASEFGILQVDRSGRIVDFVEKPRDAQVLQRLALAEEEVRQRGITPDRRYLASMGIYLFKPRVLVECLEDQRRVDFGKEVIPFAIQNYFVRALLFPGYWEDIGTIRTFYHANLELASDHPPINLFDEERPIYTRPRFLPGSRIAACQVRESIVCEGSHLEAANVQESVIGIRSMVRPGSQLRRVVMMGADYYEDGPAGHVPLGVGEDCVIQDAIIDKNARIGAGVRILNEQQVKHLDGPNFFIRDGIVIVPKNAVIPPGTVI